MVVNINLFSSYDLELGNKFVDGSRVEWSGLRANGGISFTFPSQKEKPKHSESK